MAHQRIRRGHEVYHWMDYVVAHLGIIRGAIVAHQQRRGDELDHWRGDVVAHWGIMKELLWLISEEREMRWIIGGEMWWPISE